MSFGRLITNATIAVLLLGFSAAYGWMSVSSLAGASRYDMVGERGYPVALAILTALIGVGIILQCAASYRGARAIGQRSDESDAVAFGTVACAWLLLVGYIVLIPRIGFLVATPLFAGASLWVVGYRRPRPVLLIALGTTFACWAVFEGLLGVMLPIASWF